jgi:glycyl-tRNA synthetase beta subunit
VHVTQVAAKAADKQVQQKLMPVAVALDAIGNATPALLKKLAALGVDAGAAAAVLPTLKRQPDGKAEALFLDSVVPGATLAEGLQTALEAALAALPIPKVMSYQLADGWSSVNFVRPAHRLVALHGADVVSISVLGLAAGRETQGHRFEAASPIVSIKDADSYARTTGSRRCRDRQLRRAPRRNRKAAEGRRREGRPAGDRRRGPARRSHRAGGTAERADLCLRAGIPRRASGMPDPDHEGQPEVLPAAQGRQG